MHSISPSWLTQNALIYLVFIQTIKSNKRQRIQVQICSTNIAQILSFFPISSEVNNTNLSPCYIRMRYVSLVLGLGS